eukprot:Nk52_evm39s217 gene=Nk52_evmTU39s217
MASSLMYGGMACALSYFFAWMEWGLLPFVCTVVFFLGILKKDEKKWKIRMLYDAERYARQEKLEHDFEYVEWLNIPIQRFWNVYEDDLSRAIVEAVQPTLDSVKPGSIKDIRFSEFTLGPKAPYLEQAKSYAKTGLKQIKMDVWCAFDAPDANIVLSVKFGLGISAPIAVKDFTFHGKVRLEAILQDDYPFVNTAKIALLESPVVDFTLKPLKGPDLMDMPGLSSFIDGLINDNIEKALVNPNFIEIPLDQMMNGKPMSEHDFTEAVGVLRITVKKAEGLTLKKTFMATCDAYCLLSIDERMEQYKTQVIKKNSNPEWNKTFRILIHKPSFQKLKINVFDENTVTPDEYIGKVVMTLDDLPFREGEVITKTFDIEDNKAEKDSLTVVCTYGKVEGCDDEKTAESQKPKEDNEWESSDEEEELTPEEIEKNTLKPEDQGGIVRINIHRAKDLAGVDNTGTSDPYVTVKDDADTKVYKTRIVKQDCDPRWNETFEVLVMDRRSYNLKFTVKDFNPAMVNEYLGELTVNLGKALGDTKKTKKTWFSLNNCEQGAIQMSFEFVRVNPIVFQKVREEDGEDIIKRRKERLKRLGKYAKKGKIFIGNPNDKEAGLLFVTVHEARKLIAADSSLFGKGSSDPFCIVKVGDKYCYKTRTVKKSLTPSWEESFTIRTRKNAETTLNFHLFDYDRTSSDDPLGDCSVCLEELGENNEISKWIKLNNTKHGEVRLTLRYTPRTENHVPTDAELAEAEDLAAIDRDMEEDGVLDGALDFSKNIVGGAVGGVGTVGKGAISGIGAIGKGGMKVTRGAGSIVGLGGKKNSGDSSASTPAKDPMSPTEARVSSPSIAGSMSPDARRVIEVQVVEATEFPMKGNNGEYLRPLVKILVDGGKASAKTHAWKQHTLPNWNEALRLKRIKPNSEITVRVEEKGLIGSGHGLFEGKFNLADYLHPETSDRVDVKCQLSPLDLHSNLIGENPHINMSIRYI